MADDLDDVAEPGDLEAELDDELDEDLEVDLEDEDAVDLGDDDDDDVAVDDEDDDDDELAPVASAEEDADDDEEVDDEDVEASLDEILKERLVVEDDEPDEDEPADPEDRGEGGERVVPKRPDEFVCQSCFLVKHPSQLADPERVLCRDCV
jgi:hypothetical protein